MLYDFPDPGGKDAGLSVELFFSQRIPLASLPIYISSTESEKAWGNSCTGTRTGKNTSVKASKSMFKEVLPKVIVKGLLTTIIWLIPRASRPIRFIKAE